MHRDLLLRTADLAIDFLDRLPQRSMVVTTDSASVTIRAPASATVFHATRRRRFIGALLRRGV